MLGEIEVKERELQKSPKDLHILNQLKLLQQQISLLTVSDIKKKLKFTKQHFLEHANKPGRWLAHKFKKQTEKKDYN